MALKASMKIIIVDPAAGNRQYLKKMLSDIGFKNVIEAGDGEAAWAKIDASREDSPVALVICEWDVPKIAGLDLLKKMRADETFKSSKFLMVVGEAAQQNIVIAVKSGVNNVMIRPFSANTLTEKIAKTFGK